MKSGRFFEKGEIRMDLKISAEQKIMDKLRKKGEWHAIHRTLGIG